MANYWLRAEAARLHWDYTMQRLFGGFGVPPEQHHANDCSGYVGLGFHWAMHETGIFLPDPLGPERKYNGSGNTTSMFAIVKGHPTPVGKYLVGDVAFWTHKDNPRAIVHVSVCRKAGTTTSAIFSSNGHMSTIFGSDAPEPLTLGSEAVRQHLYGVYRYPVFL